MLRIADVSSNPQCEAEQDVVETLGGGNEFEKSLNIPFYEG